MEPKNVLEDTRMIKHLQVGVGEFARLFTVDDDEYTKFTEIRPVYDDDLQAVRYAIYTGGDEPSEFVNPEFVAIRVYFKD